uniref:Putative secreted protein n=1 Tax=Anopheles darlingi TaxID=43151 RepID=A0A2M4DC91_ANODA
MTMLMMLTTITTTAQGCRWLAALLLLDDRATAKAFACPPLFCCTPSSTLSLSLPLSRTLYIQHFLLQYTRQSSGLLIRKHTRRG